MICCICKQETRRCIIDQETLQAICLHCYQLVGHCATCKHQAQCSFQSDPSPLPHIVRQQIQQGPAFIVTDVKNPERIRITCQNGCKCSDGEIGCWKENAAQVCGNYEEDLNNVIIRR